MAVVLAADLLGGCQGSLTRRRAASAERCLERGIRAVDERHVQVRCREGREERRCGGPGRRERPGNPADADGRAKLGEKVPKETEKAYPSLRTVTARAADFKEGTFTSQAANEPKRSNLSLRPHTTTAEKHIRKGTTSAGRLPTTMRPSDSIRLTRRPTATAAF